MQHSTDPGRAQGHVLSQHRAARLHRSYINLQQLRSQPQAGQQQPTPGTEPAAARGKLENPRAAAAQLLPHSSGQAAAPGLARDTRVSEAQPCWHSALPGGHHPCYSKESPPLSWAGKAAWNCHFCVWVDQEFSCEMCCSPSLPHSSTN